MAPVKPEDVKVPFTLEQVQSIKELSGMDTNPRMTFDSPALSGNMDCSVDEYRPMGSNCGARTFGYFNARLNAKGGKAGEAVKDTYTERLQYFTMFMWVPWLKLANNFPYARITSMGVTKLENALGIPNSHKDLEKELNLKSALEGLGWSVRIVYKSAHGYEESERFIYLMHVLEQEQVYQYRGIRKTNNPILIALREKVLSYGYTLT